VKTVVKNQTPYPKEGQFIMGRVADIQSQYIYVDLPDYDGLPSEECARGMIHISEVSSRWVRNIRSFVRINQRLVLRVIKVVPDKGQIDLSLRRVNSAQKDILKKEYKYANKCENLLQFLTEVEALFYRVEIVSKDYIDAESILSDALEVLENSMNENGTFEFIRD
jgi:translation initiation factor 2 alpha subunit (eIF-2alpha)